MKCKCDFRTFMVGDGCDVCNPAKALEYARETIDEQAALIEEMGEALERIAKDEWKKGCGFCHPEGCESPSIAKKALAKWKESK